MRILLAEDDEQLNKSLCFQLESKGFSVDTCFDGEEASYYGEQNIYDVILLDRMLPCKEGTEVLTSLRAKGIVTPIILITALGTLSDKVTGLDLGADDYLVKPFAFEELLARIRCVIRRPHAITGDDLLSVSIAGIPLANRKIQIKITAAIDMQAVRKNRHFIIFSLRWSIAVPLIVIYRSSLLHCL